MLEDVSRAFPSDTIIDPNSPNDYAKAMYADDEAGVVFEFLANEAKVAEIGSFAQRRWSEKIDTVSAELRQRFGA